MKNYIVAEIAAVLIPELKTYVKPPQGATWYEEIITKIIRENLDKLEAIFKAHINTRRATERELEFEKQIEALKQQHQITKNELDNEVKYRLKLVGEHNKTLDQYKQAKAANEELAKEVERLHKVADNAKAEAATHKSIVTLIGQLHNAAVNNV